MAALAAGAAGAGCATQDNGDLVNDDNAGSSFSGNGTSSGSGGGGNSNGGNGSAGTVSKAGMSNGGNGNAGTGTAGSDDGGSSGTATGGTGGASAGAGGKGGGGAGGAGGKGGAGGAGGQPQVDTCKNGKLDNNETDSDCGGVCAAKCATGKMCDTVNDCVLTNVCEDSKCRAQGCTVDGCAYAMTRFVIASSAIKAQALVSWDSDSLDIDIQVLDATPQDDSPNNWEDDSVEIYLDLNHANSVAYEADDFQITVPRAAGTLSGLGNYTMAAVVVARTTDATGYTLQISIPWNALNGAASPVGSTIGFDIGVNDDSDGGTRNAQLMIYGSDQNYANTSGFGDLMLTP